MRILTRDSIVRLLFAALQSLTLAVALNPPIANAAIVAGRTPATFAVSSSGAATYQIPLWSPPGVGDVQLDLALVYNSRTPNGVLGVGWSLSGLSAITRCNKTWAQDGAPQGVLLTLSDRFCLDGQQLKLVSAPGTYGQPNSVYATEIESFSRIVASATTSGNGPASFTVTTKNGLIYEYGLTADAQIKPGGGATIQTWALSKIRDRFGTYGNRITFAYTNDTANNTYRIASIAYPTTATGQDPFYEVLFAYVARPSNDIPSSYSAGFVSRELNRLTTITIRNYGSPTPTKIYNLTYNQGTATNRSRLTSLQECSALNCLPAAAIAYQSGSSGWSSTLLSTGVTTSTSLVAGPIPVDFNGDGLTDILYPRALTSSTSTWSAVLATTSGFGAPINTGIVTTDVDLEIVGAFSGTGQQQLLMKLGGYWTLVQYNSAGYFTTASTGVPAGTEYAAVDWNGDGLPDLASIVGNEFRVRRNTTVPPGAVSFAATPETIFTYTGGWNIAGGTSYWLKLSDYNGDGRGDLYFLTYFNTGFGNILQGEVLLSNGFGAQAANSSHLFSPGWTTLGADWNADGCTDIVGSKLYISNCAGGFSELSGGAGSATSIMATDWDGDSRSDLLYVNTSNNTWYVIRSTGEGAATAVSTGTAAPLGTSWFTFDKDGDGLADLGYRDVGSNPLLKYRLHNGATVPADLATSFTDGFGINQSPSYKTISRNNYTKHTDAGFPEQDFQGPLYVVGDLSASDGIGGTYTQTFHYWGARLHVQGRGFEGFYARRMIDSRNGLYNYDYLGRTFPHTGMLVGQTLSSPTAEIGKWISVQASQPLGVTGIQQRVFPFLSSTTHSEFELGGPLDGNLITQRITNWTYGDGYGNPTVVSTSTTDKDLSSPFYNSTWQTTVTTAYDNNVTQNCLGLPLTSDVTSAVPGQTTKTRQYGYANNVTLCRVREETIEPNIPALKVTTTLAFDSSCGNLESVQVVGSNPNGTSMPARTTLLGFGARCQLPESVTNALIQTTNFAYFDDFGALQTVSDPNVFLTEWQIDDFGRRTREDRPDGTATVWTYARCATPPCWGAADLRLRVTEDQRDTANVSFNTRQLHYDGMDRLRTDETNRVLGVWTKNEVLYDALGRVATRYQPKSSGSNGHFAWTYDSLGRVLNEKLFQGSGALDRTTIYEYAGRTTSITDPLIRVTEQVRDVTKRLRQVIDPTPGGTTAYEYDAFGNLNKITDPINAISTGIYNLRGFQTQWADIDRGVWNFTPNSLNELVSWTNAKLQPFSAIYDPLGRMTSRTEPEGTSIFVWGALATENNIGSLKYKSGYGYLEELFYDGVGRLSNRRITTDQIYNYDYAYNSLGTISTITYPTSPVPSGLTGTRFKTRYSYSFGEPFKIEDATQAPAKTLWTLNTANDYSSPLTETLATTPTTTSVTNGYRPWTNELTSVQSGVGLGLQTNRQNLVYDWDTVGNLKHRQDLGQGLTEIFVHDALDRVKSSTLNSAPNLTMSYDTAGAGNINTKTGISGTYNYTTAQTGCTYYAHSQPHAVRNAGGVIYCYDQNGNVVKRGGLTQTWASFNLPTVLQATVNGSTYQSQFAYGPDHQRWRQIGTYANGTETTHYVGGLLEKVQATSTGLTYWRHYVPTPSGLTAIVSRNSNNSTWTTFALSDHLGSSDALLDLSGAFEVRESFDAFGARRGSNWTTSTPPDWAGIADTTRRGFTFHEMLDNIGLIHMNGRVYEPAIGRFLSVDPFIPNLADSQSVNPYAYVGNRPLSFTDPTGFCLEQPGNVVCTAQSFASQNYVKGVVDLIVDIFSIFGLFGSGPPPPPPAKTFPGTSAQNGVNICDPGMSSPSCGGGLPNVMQLDSPEAVDAVILGRVATGATFACPECVVLGTVVVGSLIMVRPFVALNVLSRPDYSGGKTRVGGKDSKQVTVSPTDQVGSPTGPDDDDPRKLKRIHSDETHDSPGLNRDSLEYWRGQRTEDIVRSLEPRPGNDEGLIVNQRGSVLQGNTRLKVLQDRGYDIQSLPREVHVQPGLE
jgi:RHS repeat-associated protein